MPPSETFGMDLRPEAVLMHRIVLGVLVLAVAASCKGKDEAVPVASKAPPPETASKAPARPQGTTRASGTPAATPAANADAAALAAAKQVFTVQVAALREAEAKWWVAELQRQQIPAYWTTATVGGNEVIRLRIGAALSGTEARAIADRISARYKWPTWVTTVDDRAVLPANVLSSSRTYSGAR